MKKDEPLASFYSPQFRAAQRAYLMHHWFAGADRFQAGGRQRSGPTLMRPLAPSKQATFSLQTYIDALESLGMSEPQMREMASTRNITDKVSIVAPVTGFVLAATSLPVSASTRAPSGTVSPT